MTARAVEDEPNVSSPPVCGLQPGRPGVKFKPLYFTTRRLSGDGPTSELHGAATGIGTQRASRSGAAHAAPSGSWSARPACGPTHPKPKLNGGFLVFLPPSTRPSARCRRDRRRQAPRRARSRHGPGRPSRAARRRPSSVPRRPTGAEPGGLADGRYAPGWVQYRVTTSKLAVTLDDPAGGLPLGAAPVRRRPRRSSTGRRARWRARGGSGAAAACSSAACAARRSAGSTPTGSSGRPGPSTRCCSARRSSARSRWGSWCRRSRVADPAAPAITGSVLWGYIPGAKAATVSGAGSADGHGEGQRRRVPAPGRGRRAAGWPRACRGGGKTVRFGSPGRPVGDHPPLHVPDADRRHRDARGARARSGRAARTWRCGWRSPRRACPASSGRRRSSATARAHVDLRLALFTERRAERTRSCRPLRDASRTPSARATSAGAAATPRSSRARTPSSPRRASQRRLLAGRTNVSGQCTADVERVTLRTPRDVRTLVPSAVGRAVPGRLRRDCSSTASLGVTAHLKDGTTWTDRFPLASF